MKLHRSATETRSKQDDSAPGKSAKTRIATQSAGYNDIFRRACDQPETLNPAEIQILTSRMGNHALQRLLNGEKTTLSPTAVATLSRKGQRFVIQRFPDEEAVKTRAHLIKKNKWQEKSGQDDKGDYYQALNEFRRIEQHS